MSSAELITINLDGNAAHSGIRFRNSHGVYSATWTVLMGIYFPSESAYSAERLWEASEEYEPFSFEKTCLFFTYDRVAVARQDIPTVASAFESFDVRHRFRWPAHYVCHWRALANQLRELEKDSDVLAVGMQHSISDQWTSLHDHENDQPYNVLRGTRHGWLRFRDDVPVIEDP